MYETPIIQWWVAVQLLSGNPAIVTVEESLCRQMAEHLRYGEHITGFFNNGTQEVRFLQCARAANGIIVEVLPSKK